MKPLQAIKHYGTQVKLAAALDLTQPAISRWIRHGRIPELQQLRIESDTGGALKADKKILPKRRPS